MRMLAKVISLSAFFLSYLFFVTPFCLGGELIAPTRTLQRTGELPGKLSVLSEPPGLDVFLEGSNIGKTPVWFKEVKPGSHRLRVKHSETQIYVDAGSTLQISLFKGYFINIPKGEKQVEKPAGSEEKEITEARKTMEPPKEQRERDLTPWELFINGTSRHF